MASQLRWNQGSEALERQVDADEEAEERRLEEEISSVLDSSTSSSLSGLSLRDDTHDGRFEISAGASDISKCSEPVALPAFIGGRVIRPAEHARCATSDFWSRGVAMPGMSTRSATTEPPAAGRHRSHGSRLSTPHLKSEDNVPLRQRFRSCSRHHAYSKDDDSLSSVSVTTGRFVSDSSFSGTSASPSCPVHHVAVLGSPQKSDTLHLLSCLLLFHTCFRLPFGCLSRRSLRSSPPPNVAVHKLRSPVSTPALARRIDPEPHPNTQGLVIPASNTSPAFLCQPVLHTASRSMTAFSKAISELL
ncbi:hypothetical protein FISHEDRAFT_74372 [Fistulina hepatica ATCC 64428]|uniref:Uncharacterized protein n=1 Tax=Fistulina hepatica ATCC 64428 TaxID=1128425 RepID=A0A0D7AA38_9AGAR|nr:hypothetical protein FISHEDRAFT_74372 [Fistulina hepatica ATCC 64428]